MPADSRWDLASALDVAKQRDWQGPLAAVRKQALCVTARPAEREFTLLHHAAYWGIGDLRALLASADASGQAIDLAVLSLKGQTAADVAAAQGHGDAVRLLEHRRGSVLRVATYNVYLLPSMMVNADNASCTRQAERGEAIGALLCAQSVDVALLQEMWGASVAELEAAAAARLRTFPPLRRSWGLSLLDTAAFYLRKTGGLFGLAAGGLRVEHFTTCTFRTSNTRSQKGAFLAVLQPGKGWAAEWQNCRLVIVNTHLDPTNHGGAQEQQLEQLFGFVADNVAALAGDVVSSWAGLLCGDMNIDAGKSGLYHALLSGGGRVALRDLTGGAGGATYCSRENSLARWGVQQRIDHMLAIDAVDATSLSRLEATAVRVLRQPAGEELSDHWPIVADLRLAK